jgi:thiamine biosynthesis protein ThiS
MVTVSINGEEREVAVGTTVAVLLRSLGYEPRTVAVERNGAILARSAFEGTALEAGDRLEIVRFVQGG